MAPQLSGMQQVPSSGSDTSRAMTLKRGAMLCDPGDSEKPPKAEVGNLFSGRAIWTFVTSFAGHTKLPT